MTNLMISVVFVNNEVVLNIGKYDDFTFGMDEYRSEKGI